MGEPDRAQVRYAAFLSYSHKDAAAAGRLHRRLETYRLPRRLVGTDSARGSVPERLWPIFRDREELPAATDLSDTVREALARSGALIILCSPYSAGSLWVAEEIETFRTLHPDRPILAAILDGSPPDCFPAALRASGNDGKWHEPLAADLRSGGDGAHLGLLKLVAGITGVGLDSLVQRDATRRVRRVMVVTIVAVIAMLIMAALAWVALDARREAERQRAEAEGLVEFMLTDLRTNLRSVGRLDIMQAVNQRAFAHYGRQQSLGSLPADSLARRARILQAIGEDDGSVGNLQAALSAFLEARRTTAEQLARSPNDPQRLYEHAMSEYWVGSVYEARRDWPAAERQYRIYGAAADRLLVADPGNAEYMTRVAWSAINLGNVQLNYMQDYGAAQRSYEKAVHWFARAIEARPSDRDAPRVLANAYGWLADSFYMRQMFPQSLGARERQYRIVERLLQERPNNADYVYRFALAQASIAPSLTATGDTSRARAELLRAYETSGRLVERDPRNAEWRLFRVSVGCRLYYGRLDLPAELMRRLPREIAVADEQLRRANDPRRSQVLNCLNALESNR